MSKTLIIGRSLVSSAFNDSPNVDIVSHDHWHYAAKWDYSAVVCTAAITTEAKCQASTMSQVLQANVNLPVQIARLTRARNVPLVTFSTAAVYKSPTHNNESSDINPHNRYTSSKILMEYELLEHVNYSRLYIFRIPLVCFFSDHPNDFERRIQNWSHCENITGSLVFKDTLKNAITNTINTTPPQGIYNIATRAIHFPTFLAHEFQWQGKTVPANSLNRPPNPYLNIDKAISHKLVKSTDVDSPYATVAGHNPPKLNTTTL